MRIGKYSLLSKDPMTHERVRKIDGFKDISEHDLEKVIEFYKQIGVILTEIAVGEIESDNEKGNQNEMEWTVPKTQE